MDSSFIEQLKGKLLETKKMIVAQLEQMTQEKSFNKDKVQAKWQEMGDKEEDNAVEVANFQDNISLERDLEVNLERIEKALQKIVQGEYGKCEKCGSDIEEARLTAYPEAAHCLKCASEPRL